VHRIERLISRRGAVEASVAAGTAALGFVQYLNASTAIGIIVVAAWVLAAAVVLARPRPLSTPALAAVGCLAGLFVLSLVSMAWADDAGRAFIAAARVGGYLGLLVLVVAAVPSTGIRPWLVGIAAGISLIVLVALASRCDPALFGGGDRSLAEQFANAGGRLSYPIGYWNGLAACAALGLVLLAWLADSASPRMRALAVGLMPAHWLTVYLTSSRGGLVAAVVGLAALVALGRRRLPRSLSIALGVAGGSVLLLAARGNSGFLAGADTSSARHYGALMAAATLAVGAIAAFVRLRANGWIERPRQTPRVKTRLAVPVAVVLGAIALVAINPISRYEEFSRPGFGASSFNPGQRAILSASGTGRAQFWSVALDAWESSPVHGVGAGNYELYWNAHPDGEIVVVNAHSLYLETLAELGPAGLVLILGFLLAAPALMLRRLRDRDDDDLAAALAIVAAGAVSAALDWTFQVPAAFAPVVVGVGAVAAAGPVRRVATLPRRQGLTRAAAVAVAWLAVGSGVVILVMEQALSASRDADRRGDLAAAVSDARRAASVAPFSPEPQFQLALVQLQAGNLDAAAAAASEATRLAPGDWRSWLVSLQVAAAQHDRAAGVEAARRIQATLPVSIGELPNGG
jgi:O-Antigen ligase